MKIFKNIIEKNVTIILSMLFFCTPFVYSNSANQQSRIHCITITDDVATVNRINLDSIGGELKATETSQTSKDDVCLQHNNGINSSILVEASHQKIMDENNLSNESLNDRRDSSSEPRWEYGHWADHLLLSIGGQYLGSDLVYTGQFLVWKVDLIPGINRLIIGTRVLEFIGGFSDYYYSEGTLWDWFPISASYMLYAKVKSGQALNYWSDMRYVYWYPGDKTRIHTLAPYILVEASGSMFPEKPLLKHFDIYLKAGYCIVDESDTPPTLNLHCSIRTGIRFWENVNSIHVPVPPSKEFFIELNVGEGLVRYFE